MNQGLCLLCDIAIHTQPAAVDFPAFRQVRLNAAMSQFITVRLAVVSTVGIQVIRTLTGTTDLTGYRRDGIDQW